MHAVNWDGHQLDSVSVDNIKGGFDFFSSYVAYSYRKKN